MIEDFFLFFQSQLWQTIVSILKPVCFVAILIFLSAIIWSLKKSSWLYWYITEDIKDFIRGSPIPLQEKSKKRWNKIKKRMKSKREGNWKLAVIEGGEVVEDVLLKMGYKGKSIKARLATATEAQIPNLKDLLEAGEIYEHVISDPDFQLTREKAEKVLNIFEEFLRYFEYL